MNLFNELKLAIYECHTFDDDDREVCLSALESCNDDEEFFETANNIMYLMENTTCENVKETLTSGNNTNIHPLSKNFVHDVYFIIEKYLPKDYETCNIGCIFNNKGCQISSIHYSTKYEENLDLMKNKRCSKFNFVQKQQNKIFVRSLLDLTMIIAKERFFKDIQCKTASIKIDRNGHFNIDIGYED
ncbi:MAG TPA: hypothetical protein DCW90_22345 [Lachnospiraceae bacterium]|nr:hypothetical protein [Lachnospiraceae bacterium]